MKMVNVHLFAIFMIIGGVKCSVIRLEGEKAQSLYDNNDKVFVLTSHNFYQSVFNQPYGSNVEFYNSFCGFCRNFAPIYKEFAEDVYEWRDIIRISAIDCADDANNDICRDMEIMQYPTLRYFPPYYRNESNHLGIEINHAPRQVGELHLLELMGNTTISPINSWPNLLPIESTSVDSLFDSLPNHIQYVFIVYDAQNESTVAQKVALDLRGNSNIQIRRVNLIPIANKLELRTPSAVYVGVRSSRTIELVKQLDELNRNTVRSTIEYYLKSNGIQMIPVTPTVIPISKATVVINEIDDIDLAVVEYVKSHPQLVFQADLESAIRFAIFHELVKFNNMDNEQIAALKGFLSVLQKYVTIFSLF